MVPNTSAYAFCVSILSFTLSFGTMLPCRGGFRGQIWWRSSLGLPVIGIWYWTRLKPLLGLRLWCCLKSIFVWWPRACFALTRLPWRRDWSWWWDWSTPRWWHRSSSRWRNWSVPWWPKQTCSWWWYWSTSWRWCGWFLEVLPAGGFPLGVVIPGPLPWRLPKFLKWVTLMQISLCRVPNGIEWSQFYTNV